MTALSAPGRPHVAAAILSVIVATLLLAFGALYGLRMEARHIHALAPSINRVKNQGVALQREAFAQPDLLPLYGSSELVKPIPDRASRFFRRYPTDFSVFPVGKAGATSVVLLQKLAAVGPEARGHKVAISISPGWFFSEGVAAHYYEGNFSMLQAISFAFSGELDSELKRDAARRMLQFPSTVDKAPVLRFALAKLAGDSWLDRLEYCAAWPLGKLQEAVLTAQDHYEVILLILKERPRNPHQRHASGLDWDELIARATRHMQGAEGQKETEMIQPIPEPDSDAAFRATLARAKEWGDLELLIRGMKDMGVEPLLLSMPVNGVYFERAGISRESCELYVSRLRALAAKYQVPLVDFQEHEEDPTFLVDHHDHLSVKGWMYYNRALDAFYHDQPEEMAPGTQL